MIYCRKCGNQMSDNSVFCNKCGFNQNDSLSVSNSPQNQSSHTSENDENSLYFGYSDKAFNQGVIGIIFFLLGCGVLMLLIKNETISSVIKFFAFIYTAIAIWSCIRVKKQYLRINKDSFSGTAGGVLTNSEINNMSVKGITSIKVIGDNTLLVQADKLYRFDIENAEKAQLELHKKIHNH